MLTDESCSLFSVKNGPELGWQISNICKMYIKYTNKPEIALSKVDYGFINAFDVFLKRDKGALPNTALWYHKHVKKTFNTAMALGICFT